MPVQCHQRRTCPPGRLAAPSELTDPVSGHVPSWTSASSAMGTSVVGGMVKSRRGIAGDNMAMDTKFEPPSSPSSVLDTIGHSGFSRACPLIAGCSGLHRPCLSPQPHPLKLLEAAGRFCVSPPEHFTWCGSCPQRWPWVRLLHI